MKVDAVLPLPVRIQIAFSQLVTKLSPLLVIGAAIAFLFRRKIRLPEAVPGAFAVGIAIFLLISLFILLTALVQVASYLPIQGRSP